MYRKSRRVLSDVFFEEELRHKYPLFSPMHIISALIKGPISQIA
jgi:hypothetical protein